MPVWLLSALSFRLWATERGAGTPGDMEGKPGSQQLLRLSSLLSQALDVGYSS